MRCEHEFGRRLDTPLFSDAGIIPGGDLWVVPTDAFLKLWESSAGDDLRKCGFRMCWDGRLIGASQDCVVRFTADAVMEVNG